MSTSKKRPTKFKDKPQDFIDHFLYILNNDLEGIDSSIKSKTLTNASYNLRNFIQFLSLGDEVKLLNQTSNIKHASLINITEEMEGHLSLLSNYIKSENIHYSLEKVEKLFEVKETIAKNIRQLQDINKMYSNYFYTIWGNANGSGNDNSNSRGMSMGMGNDGGNSSTGQMNNNQAGNESDSSCNNSSMSWKGKSIDSVNKIKMKMNMKPRTGSKSPINNMKSPNCLYYKAVTKNNKSPNHSSLFTIEGNNILNKDKTINSNSNAYMTINNPLRSPISSIEIKRTTKGKRVAITPNKKINKECHKELNNTKKSIDILSSSILITDNNEDDDSPHFPHFYDDNKSQGILYYQNQLKLLKKENDKINESLIEEKSINYDLKTELNKLKQQQYINQNNQCISIKDSSNSTLPNTLGIQSNLNDITEMICNVSTMESQLRKNIMSSSLSIDNSFNITDFSTTHHTIKDTLTTISSIILLIKEALTISQSSSQFVNSQSQREINNLKLSHAEIVLQKDNEIQSVIKLNNDLKNQLDASNRTASSSLVTKDEVEKYIMKISDCQGTESIAVQQLNKDVRDLREMVAMKEKEINEMKEMYSSDIQNKTLIESIIKNELIATKETYENTVNDLRESIARKDKEISELKAKQSTNEMSMINQLKVNHQKNMSQLKELYNKTISNKNDSIESLTKQLNEIKYNNKPSSASPSLNQIASKVDVGEQEEIITSLREELRKSKEDFAIKAKTVNDLQANITSLSKQNNDGQLKHQEYNTEIESLNDKLRQITEDNSSYTTQLDQLNQHLRDFEANEKNLMEKLDTKDNEVLELTATISQMEKKIEMKEEELQSFTSHNKDNDELYEQMKMRIEELERENNDLIQRRFNQSITKGNRMTMLGKDKPVITLVHEKVHNIGIDGIVKEIIMQKTKEDEFTIDKEERMKFFEDEKARIVYSNKNIQMFFPMIEKPKPKYKGSKYQMMIYGIGKQFNILNVSKCNNNFSIISKIKEEEIPMPSYIDKSLTYEIAYHDISIPSVIIEKKKEELSLNHIELSINGIKKKRKKKIYKVISETNFTMSHKSPITFTLNKMKECTQEIIMTMNSITKPEKPLLMSNISSIYIQGIEKHFNNLKTDNESKVYYPGISYSFKGLTIIKAQSNQISFFNDNNKHQKLEIVSNSTLFTIDGLKKGIFLDIVQPMEITYDYSKEREDRNKPLRESFNNSEGIIFDNVIDFNIHNEIIRNYNCNECQTDIQLKAFDISIFSIVNHNESINDIGKQREKKLLQHIQEINDLSIEASYSKDVIALKTEESIPRINQFDITNFEKTVINDIYYCSSYKKRLDFSEYEIEGIINDQWLSAYIKPLPVQLIHMQSSTHSYISSYEKIPPSSLLSLDSIITHEYIAQYSKQDHNLFTPVKSFTHQYLSSDTKEDHSINYTLESPIIYQCLGVIKEIIKPELSIEPLINYHLLPSYSKRINPKDYQSKNNITYECPSSYSKPLSPLEYKPESLILYQCLSKSNPKPVLQITSSIKYQCKSSYNKPNPKRYKPVAITTLTYLGIPKPNKSHPHSPSSSRHEESNDEDSEYTDDEEYEKLKEDYDSLQSVHNKLKEEYDILSKKLGDVEELITQEKDEFVGLLRVAFEKLLSEIQITNKAKEYITAILRMLSFDDNDIVDIYNALGKKKGLFGFLK